MIVESLRRWKPGLLLPMIALAAVLGGCVAHYEKPGMTQAQFDRDKRECEVIAEREYARKGTRVCDEVDLCLKQRGWTTSGPSLGF